MKLQGNIIIVAVVTILIKIYYAIKIDLTTCDVSTIRCTYLPILLFCQYRLNIIGNRHSLQPFNPLQRRFVYGEWGAPDWQTLRHRTTRRECQQAKRQKGYAEEVFHCVTIFLIFLFFTATSSALPMGQGARE